jgi:hypothetical protein
MIEITYDNINLEILINMQLFTKIIKAIYDSNVKDDIEKEKKIIIVTNTQIFLFAILIDDAINKGVSIAAPNGSQKIGFIVQE